MTRLTIEDHRRDSAGLTYVYPVLSRRSGGLSIGINLNPNNACNWRCVYCQVSNLQRGSAPPIDLAILAEELRDLLAQIQSGDFYLRHECPPEQQRVCDIAISGNGEPTSAAELMQVIDLLETITRETALPGTINLVLISNGSLMQRSYVQQALQHWHALGGEVWFKLDSATREGLTRINHTPLTPDRVFDNLRLAARCCRTWLQTCLFSYDGQPPFLLEQTAYRDFVTRALNEGIKLQGILLYGLARPSLQPEASRLGMLPREWLETFAEPLRALGLTVKVSC